MAALASMPLTELCVSTTFSRSIRCCCDGALTPSACVLTGRYIQESYVLGDTTALSVQDLDFTPCSDLGGCGSGTLVASPATYAGRTQAVCCGTTTCAGNPQEGGGLQYCPSSDQIASFPTEAEARAACPADASCRAVYDEGCDGSGTFWTCSYTGGLSSSGLSLIHI